VKGVAGKRQRLRGICGDFFTTQIESNLTKPILGMKARQTALARIDGVQKDEESRRRMVTGPTESQRLFQRTSVARTDGRRTSPPVTRVYFSGNRVLEVVFSEILWCSRFPDIDLGSGSTGVTIIVVVVVM
jgi:hypothetical protein